MRRMAMLGILGIGSVLITSCGLFGQNHDVKIEVTGSGKADKIVYTMPGGQSVTATGADLPWSQQATTGFGFIKVNADVSQGPVSCKITADGKEVVNKSSGNAKTLDCFYSVQDK